MSRLLPDRFIVLILMALAAGWLLPVGGAALDVAQNVIFIGVFLLFFLHGLRLPRGEVVKAARSWRVQAAMMGFIFIAMPIAGWGLASAASPALPPLLVAGIIYTAILPSTVQSAISYSSIAQGNVAASVIGAALSNLAGIVLTPALAALLLGAAGVGLDSNVIVKIATMLMLPFALGQLAQRLLGEWAARQKALLGFFDKGVILLAVYISFAGAVASGALMQLDGPIWVALALTLALLLAAAFAGAMLLGGLLQMERADRISLIFAGAHKSIATGAPMAAILFGGNAGLIILPAILYHMAQLVISAPLAARLARNHPK
ncbi:bile acid:sodium symporter family protein [Sphingorhabdus arenilitoris]|uniref:Bile acid:sodium symporter family protein n=1 Tax=Sphingorhabdus arenilitoris TaxID=1490041 RepID=A0ABV8RF88_9SPHN